MIGENFVWKLNKDQYNKLKSWYEEILSNKCNGDEYFGPIGGEVSFEIIPTSIGIFAKAEFCGEELDLSDI